MRVAFDFDSVATNRYSGFYSYGAGLLRGFGKLVGRPEAVLFYSGRFEDTARRFKDEYPEWVTLRPSAVKARMLENIWRYVNYPSLEGLIGEFDIYHSVHHLMPPTKGKPRVLTVHDLRRYKLKELYSHSKLWRFELAVKRADHFITVSQSTKNDLCEIFGIAGERVDVIHLAADEDLAVLGEAEKNKIKSRLSEAIKRPLDKYVIAISSPDVRKNIARTIRAFKSAVKQLPAGMKLVLAGIRPKEFDNDAIKDCDEDVIWAGPVDNMGEWLGCAEAFVFASHYEGFGVPIVEAFSCGVPVITSNRSSMPEVAGGAAVLVEPNDERAISNAIAAVCSDEKLRNRLIRTGLERKKCFSWEKTAFKTLEVYKKVLEERV